MSSTNSSHRRGRSTSFVERPQSRRASETELIAAAADPKTADEIGRKAVLTMRTALGQRSVAPDEAVHVDVCSLLPTRRPASFQEMHSFIGRAAVTTKSGSSAVWFESLNELAHIRDILLTCDVAGMASQPTLVSWPLGRGARHHFPDLLYIDSDGRLVASDVTRSSKLVRPAALAQFVLMAATARAAGWRYEVRTELPAQRVRNVGHIHACRFASPVAAAERLARVRASGLPRQVHQLTENGGSSMTDVLHLVATRQLFIDLDAPITPSTLVHDTPQKAVRPWLREMA